MNWKNDSNKILLFTAYLLFFISSCQLKQSVPDTEATKKEVKETSDVQDITIPKPQEKYMVWKTSQGEIELSNIQDVDSTILVDIKYAGTDNFMGKAVYRNMDKAFLQAEVATMLAEAHRYLNEHYPGFRFLVYDAARPLCVQKEMYEAVKNTPYHLYVATPDRTSLHNYAAAVDLTVIDENGAPLDMGTGFDYFGKAAGPAYEKELLEKGILNQEQIANRKLLRTAMLHAGFHSIRGEWWHFNACSLSEARQKFPLIECF